MPPVCSFLSRHQRSKLTPSGFSAVDSSCDSVQFGDGVFLCRYFAHVGRLAATANAMLLHKALKHRMWDDSRHVTRQLPGIGSLLAGRS